MKGWEQYYKDHLMSAEDAVRMVRSGDFILDGHGHGRSPILSHALMKRANELHDVKLYTGYNMVPSEYCDPQYEGSFKHVSAFNIPGTRQAQWEGRASFLPATFSQTIPTLKSIHPRVLFTQVTPPDKHGNISLSVSCDYMREMIDECELVIVQVNRKMPWISGDAVIPLEKISAFVECDSDVPEIPETVAEKVSDIDKAIARNIAGLIEDGDCLQVGVGSIPDTVLQFLTDRRHLGIHTELGSTGIMRLMEAGVIDNSRKTLDTGKAVCSLMGGTKEFYDYIDHNDNFLMRSCSYVINPNIICQQNQMVAINSAIQVDLCGQACSEMISGKQFSGVGGQLDFLRGAMMAKKGRSILCMPSTAGKGKFSRIVCNMDPGSVVTDTRYDVMYVVTEYGAANLWGKDNDERAKALINIAHPDFQEQLEKDFWNNIHKAV